MQGYYPYDKPTEHLKKLLDFLCCPCCHGDLSIEQAGLRCKSCQIEYPQEDGIFKFCLSKEDKYIDEEEILFEKMKEYKDTFSGEQ